jgi:hypothetical protein
VPSSTLTSDPSLSGSGAGRTLGAILFGVMLATVVLELLFRLLPVSTSTKTGYYFDPMILTYPAEYSFTTSSGWSLERARRHRANNYGFLSDHDFTSNPLAIALIGDSFVEASMLAPRDRLAAQLEARMEGRLVYALGAPGTSLLDYAERVRFAAQRFGIRDFVVALEHGDIGEVLCGSGNVAAPCLDPQTLAPRVERQAPPGLLKRILRHSGLAQYLFSQLKIDPVHWLRKLLPHAAGHAPPAARNFSDVSPQAVQQILDQFFTRVQPYRCGKLILVLLNDSGPGGSSGGGSDQVRDGLRWAAARHGAVFIDAWPEVRCHSEQTGVSALVSPRDAHLNPPALGIVARQVATALATAPDPGPERPARCPAAAQGFSAAGCSFGAGCFARPPASASAIFLRRPGSGWPPS